MGSGKWVKVCERGSLQEGAVLAAQAEGVDVAVYLVEGQPYATEDLCTHGNARLSDGFVLGDCVECPLHQGQFDIRTGQPLCDPVQVPVRIYPARFSGDAVEIELGS